MNQYLIYNIQTGRADSIFTGAPNHLMLNVPDGCSCLPIDDIGGHDYSVNLEGTHVIVATPTVIPETSEAQLLLRIRKGQDGELLNCLVDFVRLCEQNGMLLPDSMKAHLDDRDRAKIKYGSQ
jgi:hypothetical protein